MKQNKPRHSCSVRVPVKLLVIVTRSNDVVPPISVTSLLTAIATLGLLPGVPVSMTTC